jgi:hypothetical protein
MKIALLSHSSRAFHGMSTTINSINIRFVNRAPVETTRIDQFPDIESAVGYNGALTLWRVDTDNRNLTLLHCYRPEHKVQSAAIDGDEILVCSTDRIEILDADFNLKRTICHPLLAGTHTIRLDANRDIWVSVAPGNAALCFARDSGDLKAAIAMDPQHGTGPALSKSPDLRQHFVPTDHQPTHVNSVVPLDGGSLLATLWIQGALSVRSADGDWREIVTGFRGCHGGRPRLDGDGFYFTDSACGIVYFIDSNGRIDHRVEINSRWLHDAEMIDERLMAVTAGDKNAFLLIDPLTGVVYDRAPCAEFGETVMFVNIYDTHDDWGGFSFADADRSTSLTQDGAPGEKSSGDRASGSPPHFGLDEQLPPLHNTMTWLPQYEFIDGFPYRLRSRRKLQNEYLLASTSIQLWSGTYELSCSVELLEGNIAIGLLDGETDNWIFSEALPIGREQINTIVEIKDAVRVKLVISAHNGDLPREIDALIYWISLQHSY